MVGACYYLGAGASQDYQEAMHWYRKAAEHENDDAKYFIGQMFYLGNGVRQDYKAALKWFEIAVEHGNKVANEMIEELHF